MVRGRPCATGSFVMLRNSPTMSGIGPKILVKRCGPDLSRSHFLPSNTIKNLLLAALPRNVFEALQPDFVHVELESRTPIYRPEDEVEWVYFPSTGMISILQTTPDSRGIELATIGKEGAVG